MLDTKHDVHAATLEDILLEAQIPSCALPQVQNVLGDIFLSNRAVHDLVKWAHLVDALIVFLHVLAAHKHLFVQEAFVARKLLEAVRDAIVTIADYADAKVIFCQAVRFVGAEAIVVMDDTS